MISLALTLVPLAVPTLPHLDEFPPVSEIRQRLEVEFAKSEKKLAKLAKKVREAVLERLSSATWTSGPGTGSQKSMDEHPRILFVRELASAARAKAKEKKNSPRVLEVLERFEWPGRIELSRGLDGGTDRPIPKNDKGFIVLGECEGLFPGYPDYMPNRYGFGTHEIAGWRTGVKAGKKASYRVRTRRERPVVETELPPWAAIDVYLHGGLPDIPLFAIPELTHRIHSRLAERRRGAGDDLPPMDQSMAFFDGRMNGFVFDAPFRRDPMIVVVPFHDIFTNDRGLFGQFPTSQHMIDVGDMPFVATQSYVEYAKTFLDMRVSSLDFIRSTPEGLQVSGAFRSAGSSIARYRVLLDLIVRAILCPEIHYPRYLALYDYTRGVVSEARTADASMDVGRRYALLLWAYVDKDPTALADFLYDELLSKPEYSFPSQESLANAFLVHMRSHQDELMAAIAERSTGGGDARIDFEREFSAGEAYLQHSDALDSQALAHSYHQFHGAAVDAVRSAAYEVVLGALDD